MSDFPAIHHCTPHPPNTHTHTHTHTANPYVSIDLRSRAWWLRLGFWLACKVWRERPQRGLPQPSLPKIFPLSASLMVPEFLPSTLHSKGQSIVPCARENSLERYGSCLIKRQGFGVKQKVSRLLQSPASLWASVSLPVSGHNIFTTYYCRIK